MTKRETGNQKIFALIDEVNYDRKDYIGNLMNDSDTESVLEESSENELYSDDIQLNLLVPEANYHIVENPTIEETLEERSSKCEKEVKEKRKENDS